jgi:5-methylcytosine-specific restriction endonuclease McrA
MSFETDCKDLAKRAKMCEHWMKLYAASAEKARTLGSGQMVITEADLERVSNDLLIQDLLDARDNPFSDKAKETDFKTLVRKGRLESARKQGIHTKKQWISLLEEFDYRCLRCGCQPLGGPTKDHIIPISRGGSDSIDNLQPLCFQCNSSGGGLDHSFNWIEWRRANGFGLGTDCFCWMRTTSKKNI